MLLQDNEENLASLHQLRDLGVQIVMDDFGTGYSSLNYLQRFPFDKIKIDRAFVANLSNGNDVALAIVQAVVSLAGVLKITAVAEGVETEQQLALVKAAGCAEIAGLHLQSAETRQGDRAAVPPRPEQAVSAA